LAFDSERELLALFRYVGESEGICSCESGEKEKGNREINHDIKKNKIASRTATILFRPDLEEKVEVVERG